MGVQPQREATPYASHSTARLERRRARRVQLATQARSGYAITVNARSSASICWPKLIGPKWCEIRQTVFGWTTQKFPFSVKTAHALKIREPHVITVTGKAFYDIGHAPAEHSNRRSTPKGYAVWEIHPVMKMEVIP